MEKQKKPVLYSEQEKNKNSLKQLPMLPVLLSSSNASGEDKQNEFVVDLSFHLNSVPSQGSQAVYKTRI